jgi:predicted transcriptional regulator
MAKAIVAESDMADDYLGPLERRVMERLWTSGPQTVGDILDALNSASDRPLAYTTVMTILVRLHEKGYATRIQTGRTYTYEAAMDEPALAATVGRRELTRLIERYGAASVAGFAEDLGSVGEPLAKRLRELAEGESR